MAERVYVIAYKCGEQPRNSCVLDILFVDTDFIEHQHSYNSNTEVSVEVWPGSDRMEDTYPRISKQEFEAAYGKINYP